MSKTKRPPKPLLQLADEYPDSKPGARLIQSLAAEVRARPKIVVIDLERNTQALPSDNGWLTMTALPGAKVRVHIEDERHGTTMTFTATIASVKHDLTMDTPRPGRSQPAPADSP